jgi:hypothetical protein
MDTWCKPEFQCFSFLLLPRTFLPEHISCTSSHYDRGHRSARSLADDAQSLMSQASHGISGTSREMQTHTWWFDAAIGSRLSGEPMSLAPSTSLLFSPPPLLPPPLVTIFCRWLLWATRDAQSPMHLHYNISGHRSSGSIGPDEVYFACLVLAGVFAYRLL